MKKNIVTAGLFSLAALAGFSATAQAGDNPWGPFTGGATLTSDYRFRGISQTDRDAAVQGWLQYDHASGFFANVWASNTDFNDTTSYDSSVEVDLTAGYNFKFGPDTTGSAKALYYWYADANAPTGAPDYDYWELMGTVGHNFGKFSVSGEIAYSPDFFASTGDAWALTGGATYPVMDTFLFFTGGLTASAHVGHQWRDISSGEDYLYYDLGATATWEQFSVDLRWVDTDLHRTECPDGGSLATDNCEGGIVLSVSAALPG